MVNTNWWNKKWGKDKICGITHSRLRPGKNKNGVPHVIVLDCKHAFYTSAILEWVKSYNKKDIPCPCCRKNFTLQNLVNNIT